jgi:hypothetical protein
MILLAATILVPDISNLAGLVLAPLAGVVGGLLGGASAWSNVLARRVGIVVGMLASVLVVNLAVGVTPPSWVAGGVPLRYLIDPFLAGLAAALIAVAILRVQGADPATDREGQGNPKSDTTGRLAVFMSYRRADSMETTGRLFDRLKGSPVIASVFRDIDSVPLGADFRQHIEEMIGKCDVGLVIIGPTWLAVRDNVGSFRLASKGDHVRQEIEAMLSVGVGVIPVLIGEAPMPMAAELPPTIKALAFKNALRVRPDPDFHRDVDKLVEGMKQFVGARGRRAASSTD